MPILSAVTTLVLLLKFNEKVLKLEPGYLSLSTNQVVRHNLMTEYLQDRKTGQFAGSIGSGKSKVPMPSGSPAIAFSHAPQKPSLPKIRWTETTVNEYGAQVHALLAGTNLPYGSKTREDVTRKIAEGTSEFKVVHPYRSYRIVRAENGTYRLRNYFRPFAPEAILELESKLDKLNASLVNN